MRDARAIGSPSSLTLCGPSELANKPHRRETGIKKKKGQLSQLLFADKETRSCSKRCRAEDSARSKTPGRQPIWQEVRFANQGTFWYLQPRLRRPSSTARPFFDTDLPHPVGAHVQVYLHGSWTTQRPSFEVTIPET